MVQTAIVQGESRVWIHQVSPEKIRGALHTKTIVSVLQIETDADSGSMVEAIIMN